MVDQVHPQANQVKLILLALIKNQPGLTPAQVQSLAQETLFFDYFTVAEAWAALEDQKLIFVTEPKYQKQKDLKGQPLLAAYLSAAGELVYKQLQGQISPPLLEQIKSLGQKAENQGELTASFSPQGDGSYLVTCQAWDQKSKLLEIQVQVATQDRARAFSEAWPKRAGQIYTHILAELSQEGQA